MRASRIGKTMAGLACLICAASLALAQPDRSLPLRSAIDGDAGFRDENGRIWTPDNVGQADAKPVPPEDRAFDPRHQVVHTPTVSLQVPEFRVIGTVPVLSRPGSSVPVVTLEASSLRLSSRERWIAPLTLANNGERTIDAELTCRFNNDGRLVEAARIQLRGVEPGQRIAAVARGPQGHLFVNNTVCSVDSPLQ